MADQVEETSVPRESLIEKIKEKIHSDDSSSSSDEETEKSKPSDPPPQPKIWRLFGREKPVHNILGGGKPADVLLWKDKKLSAGILGTVTAIWILFEVMGYHLLTFVCHALIVSLGVLFVWSNASSFINKSPPRIPEVNISEELIVNIALSIRYEFNRGLRSLREIATGHSLQKFLIVIGCFWVLSIVGSSCSLLTLVYVDFLMMFTIPYLYDKYEDKVDPLAEKATIELKKHYSVFNEKVLSKIPKGVGKDKKH
jgi:hypothetical protein